MASATGMGPAEVIPKVFRPFNHQPTVFTGVTRSMAATKSAVGIRPLHDRVIVQRIEEGEQKVGGIIIPDSAKEKPQQGKVIAVGKGKVEKDGKVTPLDVKEGDTILFGKYSGQEIKLEGQEYLIMREEEILGIITK